MYLSALSRTQRVIYQEEKLLTKHKTLVFGVCIREMSTSLLENYRSVNLDWYATLELSKVFQAMREKRSKVELWEIKFHHDNSFCHVSLKTKAFLDSSIKILFHPPYNFNLALYHFVLFIEVIKPRQPSPGLLVPPPYLFLPQ